MMYLEAIFQNENFIDGVPVYVFYNDIDGKYHCDLDLQNPTGTLGIFNDVQVANDIYVLATIDIFCRRCQEAYEEMVREWLHTLTCPVKSLLRLLIQIAGSSIGLSNRKTAFGAKPWRLLA